MLTRYKKAGRMPTGGRRRKRLIALVVARVLREALFLPLLGREVPRDLSPLKPVLLGSWERWKRGRDPHPGGGSACRNVRFG